MPKPQQPQLKHKRKKPRQSPLRPNALINRPSQKDNYTNILCRIKKDVPDDQIRSTVDKINAQRLLRYPNCFSDTGRTSSTNVLGDHATAKAQWTGLNYALDVDKDVIRLLRIKTQLNALYVLNITAQKIPTAHHADTNKCPAFKDALQKMTNRRI
ncbi:hypothetical protein EVAR_40345_1 [Eumeta japonica]|uniref:Uncharacterized protein n=1 Tax=Eumeta variegata TaxID=151549 RepID=A0A4C1YCZ5_EUMVA|nr:hypothetical protein EVAR_40345_1 [Eumeta japonica]